MALQINENCIGCTFCQNECPVLAIHYNGDRYEIDSTICVGCGKCSAVCLMDAIEDSERVRVLMAEHEREESECDLVVVGGGAAGLVAAARYAELTQKKVIILEKNRKAGGGGYFAVGFMTRGNQWERDAGIQDQTEKLVDDAMALTDNQLDPAMMWNLFRSTGEFFDWLCSWAPAEECYSLRMDPRIGQMAVGTAKESYGSGKFITTHILPYLKQLGVEIRTETAAVALERNPNGSISGVLAKDPGGEVHIRCRQCLLCTGSLIRSERIRKLVPEFGKAKAKRYAHDMPGLTGDALTMAENAGIHLNEDSVVLAFVGCMPVAFEEGAFKTGERKDSIRVNLNGRRFVNETSDGRTMAEALLHQPDAVAYTVMDASILESDEVKPIPQPGMSEAGPEFPYPGGVPDFAVTRRPKTPNTMEAFRKLSEKVNVILVADTIAELAEKMGADPKGLEDEIARYNAMCARGVDDDFGKNAQLLRPLVKAPYLAIRNYLYLDGVFGGLNVTPDMQVMDADGPVPGLYAAGDITCGRYVNDLLHKTEVVSDYTWALAGGFMAANHAASQIEK